MTLEIFVVFANLDDDCFRNQNNPGFSRSFALPTYQPPLSPYSPISLPTYLPISLPTYLPILLPYLPFYPPTLFNYLSPYPTYLNHPSKFCHFWRQVFATYLILTSGDDDDQQIHFDRVDSRPSGDYDEGLFSALFVERKEPKTLRNVFLSF